MTIRSPVGGVFRGCSALWARRVLKIDRPLAGGFLGLTALQAEGCGIAIGAASRQGSEGSEGSARFQQAGSKGVVSPMEPLRGRVHRVQKVLPASSGRVQRVWYRLTAMSFIVSVTRLPSRPNCHSERSEESTVDQLKGRPFYGQAKGQLWSTRAFYAECAQYIRHMRQPALNTSQREGCRLAVRSG